MENKEVKLYDVLDSISTRKEILDVGLVTLEDCMPRLVSLGRNMEVSIVSSARTSLGLGLKSVQEDERLVRYLIRNLHTSPLETVKFTFRLEVPKFVAIHLLRHRTANINEFSQRYSNVPDKIYKPSSVSNGVRLQSKRNKQGSSDETPTEEVLELVKEAEELMEQVYLKYKQLIEKGIAREVARVILPEAVYTTLYFTLDLNNLLKFFKLRLEETAQLETRIVARAMFELVEPLIPVVISQFKEDNPNIFPKQEIA